MNKTTYNEGSVLFQSGRYQEALPFLRAAVEEEETAERWNDLGACQFAAKMTRAEDSLRRALSIDPLYPLARLNLGALLATEKRYTEAFPLLESVRGALSYGEQALVDGLLKSCRAALDSAANSSPGAAPRILFIAQNFGRNGLSEANASEAWFLYSALRRTKPAWDARFVSVENGATDRTVDVVRGIELIPLHALANCVAEPALHLLHVIHPLIKSVLYSGLEDCRVVLTLTGSDPTEFCAEEDFEAIRHLIDFGHLAVVCESEGSLAILESRDIKVRAMISPLVPAPPRASPLLTHRGKFVCGFATSPLLPEHWESRGVRILLELARLSPEIHFLIAWRTEKDEIERAVEDLQLQNVSIRAGRIDMEAFYRDVDIVTLPLGRLEGNHTSALSSVEGMLRGKPVLATEFAGIAGWLHSEGAGEVTAPTAEALRAGLSKLTAHYEVYSQQALVSARRRFDCDANAAAYHAIYAEMLETRKGPPLSQWQANVRSAGKELVRGRQSLASYYTKPEVANRYIEERFTTPPFDRLHSEELNAIPKLIRAKFGDRSDLRLLDLASGTGRLIPALVDFGFVTALDGSEAMLGVPRESCLAGVRNITGDVFHTVMDGRFHVVTCGRFLRHFEYPDRKVIYRRFHDLLREGGIVIVDVPSPRFENGFRDHAGWDKFCVYDVFWTLPSFRDELRKNGFHLANFEAIGVNVQIYEGQPDANEGCYHLVSFEKLREQKD